MTPQEQVAAIATKASIVGAGASISLTQVNEVVSIIAGVVAIFSGICAGVYYIKKNIRESRQDKNGKDQ